MARAHTAPRHDARGDRRRWLPTRPSGRAGLPHPLLNLRDATSFEVEDAVANIRAAMSHQVRPADRWPLFEVRAARLPSGHTRLFVSLDNMVFDGRSMGMIIAEWGALARAGGSPDILPKIGCSFRDIVLALCAAEEVPTGVARSTTGWPVWRPCRPPLIFPFCKRRMRRPLRAPRGGARCRSVGSAAPARAGRGVTANAVLLAAFGETLAAWSRSARFTVNLTLFQRPPLHPDIDRVVGDFTSLILLAFDGETDQTFIDRARRVRRSSRPISIMPRYRPCVCCAKWRGEPA